VPSVGDGSRDAGADRLLTRQRKDCSGREPLTPVRTLVPSLVRSRIGGSRLNEETMSAVLLPAGYYRRGFLKWAMG
jgi:hypothetical protein